MIINVSNNSNDLIPYLVSWRMKGSYNLYKEKKIWTFSKAVSFSNRMRSRGFHTEIKKVEVSGSDLRSFGVFRRSF